MINVLDYHWHTSHNRRLLSIPWMRVFFFDPRRIRGWRPDYRPPPTDDATFGGYVDGYEAGKYDLVILHVDNWCAGSGYELRAAPMRYLQSAITDDVTQVVICHGRPNNARNRQRIMSIVGDRWLVCNSHKAQEEWRHEKGVAIWHGYRVEEWPAARFAQDKPYAVAVCSGGGLSRRYHGIAIIERLKRDGVPLVWIGGQGDIACESFDQYRAVIGGGRCFVQTAQWSPMPGSRTEAMLCGIPVVTTGCDDEVLFLRDGENGFVTDSYVEMRERVQELLANVQLARRVGAAGREMARAVFNVGAYAERWREFVEGKLGMEVG